MSNKSNIDKAIESLLQNSMLAKIKAEMARPSAIEQAMKSIASQQSVWEKIKADMARPSAMEQAMKSIASQQSVWEKIKADMARPSAMEQAMKSIASQQSVWEKIKADMARPSAMEQAMKSIASQQSVWEKIKSDMARPSAIEQAMKSIASQQLVWEKLKTEMAKPSAIDQYLKLIARSKDLFINNPNCLAIMAESIVSSNAAEISDESFTNDFEYIAEELSNTPDTVSFFNVFSKLPEIFKTIIWFLLIQVFFNQLNSISANLLTPLVQDYLNENFFSTKPQVSQIKNIPICTNYIDTTNIRFITGDNVRLRESSTTNSKIIDELAFGQIVTVLSKKRNWIEVSYEYEDGELLQGWVFTRYTAKFNK